MLSDSNTYTEICQFQSGCDLFEQSTPCGLHSYCDESSGAAACHCEDNYEEDPAYTTAGGAEYTVNGQCRRIDPCNTYDCSSIGDSSCITISDAGACTCDNNYEAYEEEFKNV